MSRAVPPGSVVVTSCAITSSSDELLCIMARSCVHWTFGHDAAAMEHDDACAQAFDIVEQVRAVQDCLAARRQDRNEVAQHETGGEVEAGLRLVENEQIGIM